MTTKTQSSMLGGVVEPTWAVIKGGVVRPTETPGLSVVVEGMIHKSTGKNGDASVKDFPIVCANGTTKLTPSLPSAGYKRISAVDVSNNGSTDGVAVVTDGTPVADGGTSTGISMTNTTYSYEYWKFAGFFTNNSGATQYLKRFRFYVGEAGKVYSIRIWVGSMSINDSAATYAATGLPDWGTPGPVVDASGLNKGSGWQDYLTYTGTEVPIPNGHTCAWVVNCDTTPTRGSIAIGNDPTSSFAAKSQYAWLGRPAEGGAWIKGYINSSDHPRYLGCVVETQVFTADPVAPDVPANHYRLATLGDGTYPLRSTTTSFVTEGGGSATATKIYPNKDVVGWNKP